MAWLMLFVMIGYGLPLPHILIVQSLQEASRGATYRTELQTCGAEIFIATILRLETYLIPGETLIPGRKGEA